MGAKRFLKKFSNYLGYSKLPMKGIYSKLSILVLFGFFFSFFFFLFLILTYKKTIFFSRLDRKVLKRETKLKTD